jgi:hypothetical protein
VQPAPVSPAVEIAVKALMLRRRDPTCPALLVMDEAMRGHHGRFIDFGDIARPPAPFGLLVAEAFDGGMLPCDWVGLLAGKSHPKLPAVLNDIWVHEIWPKVIVRYSLYRG